MDQRKKLFWKRAAVISLALGLLGLLVLIWLRWGDRLMAFVSSPERVKIWLASMNGWDKPVFVAIRTLQTFAKVIPAEPLEIAAGYAYGTWGGFLLCLLGTELGSLMIIGMVKLFGHRFVNLFVPQEKIDSLRFLQREDRVWTALFILYILPGTPKDFFTFLAGLTKLNVWKFLLLSALARLPSILSSTWCGATLAEQNYWYAFAIFAGIAVTSFAGLLIWKKYHAQKQGKEETT